MTSSDQDHAALLAEIKALKKRALRAERHAEQLRRTAATSEIMSEQSKKATLRTYEKLGATIRELEVARAAAERASESKSRFLATMSHEIRTPMNGVLGTLELLLAGDLNPQQSELAQISYDSSHALLRVINDVLDYSKIEAGAMELEQIAVDVRDLVNRAVQTMRVASTERQLYLRASIEEHVPERVLGDPVRIRQILLNLIGNALKFTPSGGVELAVRVRQQELIFDVIDTGIGIPKNRIEGIFTVFSQADNSTARRFGGTGLGLAICKHLCEIMGGEITVESEINQGSTFSVSLPLREASGSLASLSHERAPPSWVPADHGFLRALVVDDNAVNRLIAQRMLQTLGVESELAAGGKQAIKRVRTTPFDIIFMDCSMPEMDGYEATRAIRALPAPASTTPVVAMTAFAGEDARTACLQAGMDDFVSKPTSIRQFQAVIRRIAMKNTAEAHVDQKIA